MILYEIGKSRSRQRPKCNELNYFPWMIAHPLWKISACNRLKVTEINQIDHKAVNWKITALLSIRANNGYGKKLPGNLADGKSTAILIEYELPKTRATRAAQSIKVNALRKLVGRIIWSNLTDFF